MLKAKVYWGTKKTDWKLHECVQSLSLITMVSVQDGWSGHINEKNSIDFKLVNMTVVL